MTVAPDRLPVVERADHIPGPPQGQWTYADYAALPDDGNRYELINGVLYMTPSPQEGHQAANGGIFARLYFHVQIGELGRVYHPPFDVILPPSDTNVQPDVIVVLNANLSIITPRNIQGAPDLIVEVSSFGTVTYDRNTKLQVYAAAGVHQYWLADPIARNVEVLVLEEGQYRSLGVFQGQATLPSQIVPDFPARVEQFFV